MISLVGSYDYEVVEFRRAPYLQLQRKRRSSISYTGVTE
jgi:hypothetical protein